MREVCNNLRGSATSSKTRARLSLASKPTSVIIPYPLQLSCGLNLAVRSAFFYVVLFKPEQWSRYCILTDSGSGRVLSALKPPLISNPARNFQLIKKLAQKMVQKISKFAILLDNRLLLPEPRQQKMRVLLAWISILSGLTRINI